MINKSWVAAAVLLGTIVASPALTQEKSTPIDTTLAAQYFQEAEAASEKDAGKLWRQPVLGPLLFVEPDTRRVVANQVDRQGLLAQYGKVYVGRLPDSITIANHIVNLGGTRFAMIVWPFMTPDKFQHVKLMAHESFHRLADGLHIPVARPSVAHLDTLEGRVWMQLEWRALHRALTASGDARSAATEDALTFRAYRRSLFPDAASSEHAFEMNEGLAEYTGYKLSAQNDGELISHVMQALDSGAAQPTLMSSFAYTAGPTYGVLLDLAGTDWRKGLTPQQDLGELLEHTLKIKIAADLKAQADKQALLYDGEALRNAEVSREDKHRKQIAAYRKRFLDSPTLLVSLTNRRSITLVSSNMVTLEDNGTVYPVSKITDAWGTLEVSKGVLMTTDENGRVQKVAVSVPEDPTARPLKGEGWTLQLAPGWGIVPGSRVGDYLIKKIDP